MATPGGPKHEKPVPMDVCSESRGADKRKRKRKKAGSKKSRKGKKPRVGAPKQACQVEALGAAERISDMATLGKQLTRFFSLHTDEQRTKAASLASALVDLAGRHWRIADVTTKQGALSLGGYLAAAPDSHGDEVGFLDGADTNQKSAWCLRAMIMAYISIEAWMGATLDVSRDDTMMRMLVSRVAATLMVVDPSAPTRKFTDGAAQSAEHAMRALRAFATPKVVSEVVPRAAGDEAFAAMFALVTRTTGPVPGPEAFLGGVEVVNDDRVTAVAALFQFHGFVKEFIRNDTVLK